MVGAARILGGRYRLEERVAAGGMGTVFAATDERLHRRVAVKLLKDDLAGDQRFVERFRREARAAAALSHPNVATVFDFGEDEGTPFIVMELVPGRDLARLLREEGPLPPERVRAVAAQLYAALAHAHAAGLVHRDVKPANVIVDDSGRVKVTDFGIARAAGESTLTQTGSVLGSAQYMAPEQASGAPVTPAADVYSAGIVLYEMLTGSVPFTADSALAVAMRHVSDDVPAPSELTPDVPADLDDLVKSATARDASARPPAAEIAAALEGRGTDPTQVMTAGTSSETTVWPIPGATYDPRRLGTQVLVVAGVLALGAVIVFAWLLSRPDDRVQRSVDRDRPAARATERPEEASQAYELDDFAGWSFPDAEQELKEQGLVVERVEIESDVPKDLVIDSVPPSGTAMSEGETVTLTVSKGPEEPDDEDKDEDSDEEGPGNSESAPGHSKGKDKKDED
ncbi:MAG TPA: protein kinase [Actinomycetota bacterium]|nr:protein kinase [Actinomycetota bacterium]